MESNSASSPVDTVASSISKLLHIEDSETPSKVESSLEPCGCVESGWQCAICLDAISFDCLAVVKGCEHTYCVHCILKWSQLKESAVTCPTCKAPFSNLLVHRQLDGTLTDFQVEESAALLARAPWYLLWCQAREKERDRYKYSVFRSLEAATLGATSDDAIAREEWAEDALYQYFEDEYEEDDALEEYYLLRGNAGSSRVAIGNRRWGANGYVSSGHRSATPVHQTRASKAAGKQCGRAAGSGCKAMPSAKGKQPPQHNTGDSPSNVPESSSSGGGRRAKRKAKRAQVNLAVSSVVGFE